MSLSVLILTRNEEENIRECVASVEWCDDVVILDSFSTDATCEIAKEAGARVYQREFMSFADQRNYAIEHIPFRNRWVFHLDADERFTKGLLAEAKQAITEDRFSGFFVPSKMMLLGRWLKFAGGYPVYQMRLMKVGEVRFARFGHGQMECNALRGVGYLTEPYVHYSFSSGFSQWLARHNTYSTSEAVMAARLMAGEDRGPEECDGDSVVVRRRRLKVMAYKLPARPVLKFLYLYIAKRGLLDGKPGFVYCVLQAFYEYMIDLKILELRRRSRRLPV